MNNNMTTERALRGVFATASFIDVGEKARADNVENDEEYLFAHSTT